MDKLLLWTGFAQNCGATDVKISTEQSQISKNRYR